MARRAAPAVAIPLDAETAPTLFDGTASRIFVLAFWTGLLTVLSLGLYRFWAKTRLRRYYWSSIRPGGVPLEYVGQPLEKLLGFLIAVTVLAFYIGVVNLLLMFVSFTFLASNFAAYALSFLGVIPLWFFARYRARRYVLARTRFRGLRLGLEPGAWGYAGRALWHWFLTLITAGLLWPRMTFWLEKYKTDRSFLGTQWLHQGGHWTMLYPAMLHLIFPAVGMAALVTSLVTRANADALFDPISFGAEMARITDPLFWFFAMAMPLWFVFGLANYRTFTFRRLTNTKTLGGVRLRALPRRWRVFKIYTLGNFLVYLGLILPLLALGIVLTGLESMVFETSPAGPALIGAAIIIYFLVFVIWGALAHAFVILPLMRHFASTLRLEGAGHLSTIGQRARDEAGQAEGFAEALDVGAAI